MKPPPPDAAWSAESVAAFCCGDQHAARFCQVFHAFCHTLDDLLDRDNPPGHEREHVVRTMLEAVTAFSANPFFQANRAGLLALITQAFLSWADSMEWQASGDRRKVRDADVIKGYYHEVFFHVALLCGGYEHARKITRNFREYDHEPGTED